MKKQFAVIGLGNFGYYLATRLFQMGHEVLGMYRGRKDWSAALDKRLAEWEKGSPDSLAITEARLVSILQMALGWSDVELVIQTGADAARFAALRADTVERRG